MVGIHALLVVYLCIFCAGLFLELFLTWINVRHLMKNGHTVPGALEGYLDRKQLETISDYTVTNQAFQKGMSVAFATVFLVLVIAGVFPRFMYGLDRFNMGDMLSGLAFFAVLGIGHAIFSLPFDYYKTFVIENRYGFNTATVKMWLVDLMKTLALGAVLGGLLLGAILLLIQYGGTLWWLWAWLVFFLFQVLLLVIYPTVIAPWFNTFVPLENADLEKKVRQVMKKGGLSVGGVFKMDAGKRSRHTNAYFSGLGKTKRIVLFDTLLEAHDDAEILAILAHEIGHWRKRHVLKTLCFVGFCSLLLFYGASLCMQWSPLYAAFGFDKQVSYVGLFLFGVLWSSVSPFFTPVGNVISRAHEREADAFAVGLLDTSDPLVRALKKLAKENLSNLHPHPLYAWFHYSHPPLVERIGRLQQDLPVRS